MNRRSPVSSSCCSSVWRSKVRTVRRSPRYRLCCRRKPVTMPSIRFVVVAQLGHRSPPKKAVRVHRPAWNSPVLGIGSRPVGALEASSARKGPAALPVILRSAFKGGIVSIRGVPRTCYQATIERVGPRRWSGLPSPPGGSLQPVAEVNMVGVGNHTRIPCAVPASGSGFGPITHQPATSLPSLHQHSVGIRR